MKSVIRIWSMVLTFAMLISMMPVSVWATACEQCQQEPCICQCTADDTCTLETGHVEGCHKYVAVCTGDADCSAATHESSCEKYVVVCTGGADCGAATHETGCEKYVPSCTGGNNCAAGHVEGCPLYVPVEPASSCREGCNKPAGHTEDCFVPCTKSARCILNDGHNACSEGLLFFNPYGAVDVVITSGYSVQTGANDHMDICFSPNGTYAQRTSVALDALEWDEEGFSLHYDDTDSTQRGQIVLTGMEIGDYTISYTHPESKRVFTVPISVTPAAIQPDNAPTVTVSVGGAFMYKNKESGKYELTWALGGAQSVKITVDDTPVSPEQITISPSENIAIKRGLNDDILFIPTGNVSSGPFSLHYKKDSSSEPVDLDIRLTTVASGAMVEGMLVAYDNVSGLARGDLYFAPGDVFETSFAIYSANTDPVLTLVDPDTLYATSDLIQIEKISATRCKLTVLQNGNGYICAMNATIPFHAIANGSGDRYYEDLVPGLLAYDKDGKLLNSITLTKDQTLENITLRYGSTGASIPVTDLDVNRVDSDVITVEKNADNTYNITAEAVGKTVIAYRDAENLDGLAVTVTNSVAGDAKLFIKNYTDPFGNKFITYLSMAPGEQFHTQFYFGETVADGQLVNVTATGAITLEETQTGYTLKADKGTGTGFVQYVSDGIAYTFPVLVTDDTNTNLQGSNTVTVNGITYGTARLAGEKMVIEPNFGSGYRENTTEDFERSFVLAAMDANGDASAEAYEKITDIRFKMLTCVDEEDRTTPSTNATLSVFETMVPSSNIKTAGATVRAQAKQGFHAVVAMSFTLEEENQLPMHITLQAGISYNIQTGNVEITITDPNPSSNTTGGPLDTAAELNVVLSNYEVFLNWLADPGEGVYVNGEFELGGSIFINLPATTYTDGLVLAQMISDKKQGSNTTPISQIRLVGDGTTMAGLIHKGGVSLVDGINFVANPDMPVEYQYNSQIESFTCGILGDSAYFDLENIPFDTAYQQRYCTGTNATDLGYALEQANMQLGYLYDTDLFWSMTTIFNVYNCTFTGYDYGIRTTPTGMVGGGTYNTFNGCYYGIHMDSNGFGVSEGNAHNVDYSSCSFSNCVYPVHLVSLPKDATPYQFRVHDSDFIHNHREFNIELAGNYYFYRNSYAGYWHKDENHPHWHDFKDKEIVLDNWDEEYRKNQHTGHRPGRYNVNDLTETDAVVVVTAGARINYNAARSGENQGYWIYSREDQNNLILKSENNLAVAQEAIEALEEDTPVTIVDNDSKPIAVITFH